MVQRSCLPDARDGLTQKERIILFCLRQLQNELQREFVPALMLYGRVSELLDISEDQCHSTIQNLTKKVEHQPYLTQNTKHIRF